MIEGKLVDLGHEPKNLQTLIQEKGTGMQAFLIYESGVFLMWKPVCHEFEME